MAKFYGAIGFANRVEERPGVWMDKIVECKYYGDLTRNSRKLQSTSNVNDDINVSNQISIVADAYAMSNYFAMKYVEFMGAKWKITDVSVEYPRLVLTIGGVYNGPEAKNEVS